MNRKKIILYIGYFIIFLLLFLTEKNLGIKMFGLAFFMALVYCNQNALLLCPLYIASSMIITPTLENVIFAFLPCIIILLAYYLHYKFNRKISLIFLSVYTFLSQLPLIIMYTEDVYQLTNTLLSLLGVQMFMYCVLTFLHPLLTRGFKYRMRHEEKLALFIFSSVLFLSISYLEPFNFSILFMVGIFILLTCKQTFFSLTIVAAASIGLGGAVGMQNYYILAVFILLALVAMALKEVNIYISALGVTLAMLAVYYYFNRGFELMVVVSYAAGAVLVMFMPRSYFKAIKSLGGNGVQNLATRTLANRDRGEVSKKLASLSRVFYDLQDILKYDLSEKKTRYDEKIITKEVCSKCCYSCPFRDNCSEKMGDTSFAVSGLVLAAMDNGKATLLDTPPVLTNQCKRVNTLINSINDTVSRFRKRKQIEQSIEQGREMIIAQMAGVGLLLDKLSEDMLAGICYDTLLEKRIFEELCRENIIANDIIVYGRNKCIDKVTLNVRVNDADNKVIGGILSAYMGTKMIETKREKNIKNSVVLHYIVAPRFDVVYGDMAISKIPYEQCGDSRKAARISEDKLMLILSDGMGSGQKAYNSSMNAIAMIESFYKAGFDHNTVLACVGRLLGLREEEDFNALDIVVVDVRTGEADFIKQGGRESFVLSDGTVEVINCGSLPLGIVDDAYPLMEQKQLSDGDIIVLASDGVLDCLGVDMIKDILLTSNTVNPQIFAELLVNNAERMAEEKGVRDDMSCIVGRIIEHK